MVQPVAVTIEYNIGGNLKSEITQIRDMSREVRANLNNNDGQGAIGSGATIGTGGGRGGTGALGNVIAGRVGAATARGGGGANAAGGFASRVLSRAGSGVGLGAAGGLLGLNNLGALSSVLGRFIPIIGGLTIASAALAGAVRTLGPEFFSNISNIQDILAPSRAIVNDSEQAVINYQNLNRLSRGFVRNLRDVSAETSFFVRSLGQPTLEYIDRNLFDFQLITQGRFTDDEATRILGNLSIDQADPGDLTALAPIFGQNFSDFRDFLNQDGNVSETFEQLIRDTIAESSPEIQSQSQRESQRRDFQEDFDQSPVGTALMEFAQEFKTAFLDIGDAIALEWWNAVRRLFGIPEVDADGNVVNNDDDNNNNNDDDGDGGFFNSLANRGIGRNFPGGRRASTGGDGFPDDGETYTTSPFFGYRGRRDEDEDEDEEDATGRSGDNVFGDPDDLSGIRPELLTPRQESDFFIPIGRSRDTNSRSNQNLLVNVDARTILDGRELARNTETTVGQALSGYRRGVVQG